MRFYSGVDTQATFTVPLISGTRESVQLATLTPSPPCPRLRFVGFPQFAWACGEEGSDPIVSHDGELVRVDEFALSRHLENQDADLAAIAGLAGLGIHVWRYGMPWRLTERQPGIYDWTLWDRALAACERHGL